MVERRDVEAAVEARHELGPGYDDHIVDSLLAKIDQRLAERRRPPHTQRPDLRLPIASIALGIGVTAVATSDAGHIAGTIIAIVYWLTIAAVNIAYAFRR